MDGWGVLDAAEGGGGGEVLDPGTAGAEGETYAEDGAVADRGQLRDEAGSSVVARGHRSEGEGIIDDDESSTFLCLGI